MRGMITDRSNIDRQFNEPLRHRRAEKRGSTRVTTNGSRDEIVT